MKTIIALLFMMLSYGAFAQVASPLPADVVMREAYIKAETEHKNVILIFESTYCGWCHEMIAAIKDPTCSKFINEYYVIVTLDILEGNREVLRSGKENPGGIDVLKSLNGNPNGGIPYWVILTAEGEIVGTAYKPHDDGTPGTAKDNVGFPGETDAGLAYFNALLKKSSKLTDDQLGVIDTRFRNNKYAKKTQ